MKFRPYFQLIRFHFHLSFVTVVLGATLFAPHLSWQLVPRLIGLYLVFNVLVYGALYTFNDLVDVDADTADPTKCLRPLPAKAITSRAAAIFCAALLGCGLLISALAFPWSITAILLGFVALNLAYTLVLKPMVYLNLAAVAATHTLRLALGITLIGARPQPLVLVSFYALLFGVATTIHSQFNLRRFEIPYYPPHRVLGIQTGCLLVSGVMAYHAHFPVAAILWGFTGIFLTLVVTSRISACRSALAALFMIKSRPRSCAS